VLATSLTTAVLGVDAHLVRVEADAASGFPKFTMVGLPDSAVRESEDRIRAALRNHGYGFKWDRRITVNLAPASLRKLGSSFDLATAVGLLATAGTVPQTLLERVLLVGELALDGRVRPVAGVLPMIGLPTWAEKPGCFQASSFWTNSCEMARLSRTGEKPLAKQRRAARCPTPAMGAKSHRTFGRRRW
jgi:predicted ATPase with chaperone activity